MVLNFYLLDAAFFHDRLRPALAASRRQRSLTPCRAVCAEVARNALPDDCLVRHVLRGLPYAKEYWQALVGELLVFGCVDLPVFPTAPETLACLLAAGPDGRSAPIRQVHFGSRELVFGGVAYRPFHVGFNDRDDVARLLADLHGVDPSAWQADALRALPELPTDDERAEELAFARDWWPSLVELYRRAATERLVVVCEEL